jgi:hypothetical protein
MDSGNEQEHVDSAAARTPRAAMTHEDVTELLASEPTPPLPGNLAAKVTDAIAAESARRGSRHEPRPARHQPAGRPWPARQWPTRPWPTLPRPRTGAPLPSRELLVPVPRSAGTRA